MMGVNPEGFRDTTVELLFHIQNGFARSQPGAVADAKDMRIDGECIFAVADVQHHIGGFAPDSRQFDQRFHGVGHLAVMIPDELLGQKVDIFGFAAVKPDGADMLADFLFAQSRHFLRRICDFEQIFRGFVDALVRGLCRQHNGNKKGENIDEIQLRFRNRVGLFQKGKKLWYLGDFHVCTIRLSLPDAIGRR